MSDADCTPGREPRSVAASLSLYSFFGRPFVKRSALCALCYRTVVCLSCNVGVLWPNSRMGPSFPTESGTAAPLIGPCLLWPNGWMDQGTAWYGGMTQLRRYCVRWGPSCPHGKGHHSPQIRFAVYGCRQSSPRSYSGPCPWRDGRHLIIVKAQFEAKIQFISIVRCHRALRLFTLIASRYCELYANYYFDIVCNKQSSIIIR